MDDQKRSILPDSVHNFYKTIGGIGNIFHLYTEDMDGNIVQEAFGKNVITDYGLYYKCYGGNGDALNSYLQIYIGNSTDEFTLESKAMISPIITSGAIRYSDGIGPSRRPTKYRLQYIPEKRVMVQVVDVIKQYFDYNISGITEPIEITEIGVGTSTTNLYSHSRVYDKDGNLSSIIKKPNEKLFITIRWQGVIPVGLIEDNYEKGISTFIEPWIFAAPNYYSSYEGFNIGYLTRSLDVHFDNVRNNMRYDSDYKNFSVTDENHISSLPAHWSPTKLYENPHLYISAVLYCSNSTVFSDPSRRWNYTSHYHDWGWFYYWNRSCINDFIMHTFEYLTEPEQIECEDVFTNAWNSSYFGYAIGTNSLLMAYPDDTSDFYHYYGHGILPVTQLDIQRIDRYNHKTKQWDLSEPFINNPTKNYDNSMFCINSNLYIESSRGSNSGKNFIVVCNPHWNSQLITSFSNSGITVYATDSYWDIESYQQIENLASVPPELGNKKYYCISGTSYTILYPYFDKADHRLDVSNKTYTGILMSSISGNGVIPSTRPIQSDEYGWILISRNLVFLDAEEGPQVHQIQYSGDQTTVDSGSRYIRYAADDVFLIGRSSTVVSNVANTYPWISFRVYQIIDPYTPPTYTDITLPFTNKPNNSSSDYSCYYSYTKDGLFAAQQLAYNELCVFDMHDPTNIIKIQNAKYGSLINLSNKLVYMNSALPDNMEFIICNGFTGEIEDTFNLPTDLGLTIYGITGWKNNVYISTSSNGTGIDYYYDTEQKQLFVLSGSWWALRTHFTNSYLYHTVVSNEECFIAASSSNNSSWSNSSGGMGSMMMISSNDPMNRKHVINSNITNSRRKPHYFPILKYTDDGNSLYLYARLAGDSSNIEEISGNFNRYMVYDIGWALDTGEQIKKMSQGDMPYLLNYEAVPYKDRVVFLRVDTDNRSLYSVPINGFLRHKITGTTRTITAYNNPVQVSGKKFQIAITNDTTKLYDYNTEYNQVT